MNCTAEDDQVLLAKWDRLQSLPCGQSDEDAVSASFPFTVEETQAMERLWKRGLIRPTSVATAEFTLEGMDQVRRLTAACL